MREDKEKDVKLFLFLECVGGGVGGGITARQGLYPAVAD